MDRIEQWVVSSIDLSNIMNKHHHIQDHLWVTVNSDTDPLGFKMPLFETDFDSGTFKGEITFVRSSSEDGFLQVSSGDTITMRYLDRNFPEKYTVEPRKMTETKGGIEIAATAIVGARGPPMERAPATDLRILDRDRNQIKDIPVDQQIRLKADLENHQNKTQPFAYLVQIKDSKNKAESLSWLSGNLTANQKQSPEVTWIPQRAGTYTATVYVWESIGNPTALSPPVELEFSVN